MVNLRGIFSTTSEMTILENEFRVSKIYNLKRFEESQCSYIKRMFKAKTKNFQKKAKDLETYKNYLYKKIPILNWLPSYEKSFIVPDLISGITIGVMNIPQGMAYSLLATLPAVHGLYISFIPLLVYFIFGTSRHLAIGSYALVSLLAGTSIERMVKQYESTLNLNSTLLMSNGSIPFDPIIADELAKYRIEVAISLTFLVGLFQIGLGLSGLGFLTSYFSDTFISSYTCASAIHVIKSQIHDLFGIDNTIHYTGLFNVPKSFHDIASKLHTSNVPTVLTSVFCILYLSTFKEFLNPIFKRKLKIEFPSELLLVAFLTIVSYFAKLNEKFDIHVIGHVPEGFPVPRLPDVNLWSQMISDAFIIANIGFAVSISMVCLYARKHKYETDSTQELYAYGLSNLVGSFFLCFPCSGSLSRTSIVESTGGKTLVNSIYSAIILLFVILFMGPLFTSLPKACLASIVVIAFKNILFQFKDLFSLWHINKLEFITWLLTFASVVILDIDYGLVIGVAISIFMIIVKDQIFQTRSLVKYDGTTEYVDSDFVANVTRSADQSVKIFKIQRSIYFANCEAFKKQLFAGYGFSPIDRFTGKNKKRNQVVTLNPVYGIDNSCDESYLNDSVLSGSDIKLKSDRSSEDVRLEELNDPDIILDFSAVNYVDTNAIKMLQQVIEDFRKIDVMVYICEPQDDFIGIIYKMKLLDKFDNNIYVTVSDALKAIREKS